MDVNSAGETRIAYRSLRQLLLFRSVDARTLRALSEYCAVSSFRAGQTVVVEGEPGRAFWVVAQGKLQAVSGGEIRGEVTAGETFGERALVGPAICDSTVRCLEESTLIRLERSAFEALLGRNPALKSVTLSITARTRGVERYRPGDEVLIAFLRTIELFSKMPDRLLRKLTTLLQWLSIPDHEDVVRQGEPGDSMFVLLNGRMRWIQRDSELRTEQSGLLYPGDVFGEMSLITGENRSASVYALRDCEVLRLEGRRFERMIQREPDLLYPLSRTLARRLTERSSQTVRPARSFCVLPLHRLDSARFSEMLAASIPGSTVLTSGDLPAGAEAEGSIEDAAFSTQIAELEKVSGCIILAADAGDTPWTRRCIRLADQILLLADPAQDPALCALELKYVQNFTGLLSDRTALVFLSDRILPGRAAAFLERRSVPFYHVRPANVADFARLARLVTGRAIGLVLGGGGARGLAHIGVYRALIESGVPVDSVGGSSMGAILAGAIAQQMNPDDVLRLALGIVRRKNPIGDYVLPLVSMIKGRRYTQAIREAFGSLLIEDLPLPYFAAASDLTLEQKVIIDRGPLWRAARASSSLPGIAPPMIEGGRLLVDGGILNNVPADTMRERGAGQILAVHIEGTETTAYDSGLARLTSRPGEAPDFARLLANRLAPREKRIEYPGLPMLLLRCALLGAKAQEQSSRAAATVWTTLPVTEYGLLDWNAAEQFMEIGYRHAMENMAAWREKLRTP